MLKIKFKSDVSPVDNLIFHIRIFYKYGKIYGNISGVKSDDSGIVYLSREQIQENLDGKDFEDIDRFGISLEEPESIQRMNEAWSFYSSVDEKIIESELITRGFEQNYIPEYVKKTKEILNKQSTIAEIYKVTNNHHHKKFGFDYEYIIKPTENTTILKI